MGTQWVVATDEEVIIDGWKHAEILLNQDLCRKIAFAVLDGKELRVCNDGNAGEYPTWFWDLPKEGEIAEALKEWEEDWLNE